MLIKCSLWFQEIIKHPRHSFVSKKNDIALIKLAEPINFTDNIAPACLNVDPNDLSPDVPLFVTGWGSTSPEREFIHSVPKGVFTWKNILFNEKFAFKISLDRMCFSKLNYKQCRSISATQSSRNIISKLINRLFWMASMMDSIVRTIHKAEWTVAKAMAVELFNTFRITQKLLMSLALYHSASAAVRHFLPFMSESRTIWIGLNKSFGPSIFKDSENVTIFKLQKKTWINE